MNKVTTEKKKLYFPTKEDLEACFAYLEEKGLDTNDEYHYEKLLESAGKENVFMKTVVDWISRLGKVYETKGFSL